MYVGIYLSLRDNLVLRAHVSFGQHRNVEDSRFHGACLVWHKTWSAEQPRPQGSLSSYAGNIGTPGQAQGGSTLWQQVSVRFTSATNVLFANAEKCLPSNYRLCH